MMGAVAAAVWPRWDRRTWRIVATVLACLLGVDLLFMVVHVLRIVLLEPNADASSLLADRRLSLGTDRGYAEWYGYAKLTFSVVALVLLGLRVQGPAYFGWALALLVLLIDDSWLVHETLGGAIAERLGLRPAFGLRAQDLGELLAWMIIGVPVLVVLVAAHRLSGPAVRRDSRMLATLTLALGFFGVAVDMLEIEATGRLAHLAGLVEDGGELIVVSAIAAFALGSMLMSLPPTRGRGPRSGQLAATADPGQPAPPPAEPGSAAHG